MHRLETAVEEARQRYKTKREEFYAKKGEQHTKAIKAWNRGADDT